MGKPIRFRKGDRITPKHAGVSPIEESLSPIKGTPILMVTSVTGTKQRPIITVDGVPGDFYAKDFKLHKSKASSKKRLPKPSQKVLAFDGLAN